MYVCMYIYIYIYMRVCIYIYIYVCVYICLRQRALKCCSKGRRDDAGALHARPLEDPGSCPSLRSTEEPPNPGDNHWGSARSLERKLKLQRAGEAET